MIDIIKFFFTVLVTGVSFSLIVIFAWFGFGMMINFWKIYVRGPREKRKREQKKCKHSGCYYNPNKELWECNDCGKNFI